MGIMSEINFVIFELRVWTFTLVTQRETLHITLIGISETSMVMKTSVYVVLKVKLKMYLITAI